MTGVVDTLAGRLKAIPYADRYTLAIQAGVPAGCITRLVGRREVNAEAYLALCRAFGIDAVTGADCDADAAPIMVMWEWLAIALRLKAIDTDNGIRARAKAVGVSVATMCRAENATRPVSAGNFIKLCAWLGHHPRIYVKQRDPAIPPAVTVLGNGSHETYGNTLKANALPNQGRAA